MGQSVGNLAHSYKKDKGTNQIVVNMNAYTFDENKNDDIYFSSRSLFGNDVIDTMNTPLPNSNNSNNNNNNNSSSNFDFTNSEDTPLFIASLSNYKHNVADIASKILPQSAWSGYQLLQMSNDQHVAPRFLKNTSKVQPDIETAENNKFTGVESLRTTDSSNPEMDQLISLMQNHRVSEDTSSFRFDFKSQPPPSTFQFSFSPGQNNQYATKTEDDDDEFQPEEIDTTPKNAISFDSNTPPPIEQSRRKIIPLKKSRWKRKLETEKNSSFIITPINDSFTKLPINNKVPVVPDSSGQYFTYTSENDRPSPSIYKNPFEFHTDTISSPPVVDIEKKDPVSPERPEVLITMDTSETTTQHHNTQSLSSRFKEFDIAPTKRKIAELPKKGKAKQPVKAKTQPPATTATVAASAPVANNKKKKANKKRKNETAAPGGFLSSDVTLFDNPISNDFICLFCQYDIFQYGLKDAKKKNGYYRRKMESLKKQGTNDLINEPLEDLFT